MEIAKVLTNEEFIKVTEAYRSSLQQDSGATAKSSTLKEIRNKLETFINKQLVKVNKAAAKDQAKLTDLLELLIIIDTHLPFEDFFKHAGLDIFPIVFKLTFYNNDHSVVNSDESDSQYLHAVRIMKPEEIREIVERQSKRSIEGKINLLVNNLLTKMVYHCDRQKLLIQAAELLYSLDKVISTQKVSKLIVYFGKIFEVVTEKRSKYLQGSLFAIGGLLKIEAKSYLQTVQKLKGDDQSFVLPCKLFNNESEIEKLEQQRIRSLPPIDVVYFEHEMLNVVIDFIRSIIKPSQGFINNEIWNFYLDFTHDKFIDQIEEEEERNPVRLNNLESAHYTLCFLFDLIQFIFQYLVTVHEAKSTFDEEMKTESFSNDAERRSSMSDYRSPIKPQEVLSLGFKFIVPKLEELVNELFRGVKAVCPNYLHLLWFWHVKNAEVEKKWDEEDQKDSYDRQDNFNVFGLSIYLFMSYKSAICHQTGTQEVLKGFDFTTMNQNQSPISSEFMFESLQPLISYCLKSKSRTIMNLGLEAASYQAFLTQNNPQVYQSLGHFTRDEQSIQFILQNIFERMGSHDLSQNIQKLSMKIIYQSLSLFNDESKIRIVNYLYQILDDEKNDRGLAILTSQFYQSLVATTSQPEIYLKNAKEEVFDILLDILKDDSPYVLDLTERIHAGLNLLLFLSIKEKTLKLTPILTEKAYVKDVVHKKYLEPLTHTIQAGISTVNEEYEKQSESELKAQVQIKRNQLEMLLDSLSFVKSRID